MLEIWIDASAFERKARAFGQRGGQVLGAVMDDAIEEAAVYLSNEVKRRAPRNTGHLVGSFFHERRGSWPRTVGIAGTPLKYAVPLEYGQRAHWPPEEPIELWARRKFGASGRQLAAIVWGVRKAIARRGRPPFGFLRAALKQNRGWLTRHFKAALAKAAERLARL